MAAPSRRVVLAAQYHDALVESITVGPRREIELVVHLNAAMNDGDSSFRRLRFSAIDNFDEAAAFFGQAVRLAPDAYLDQILGIFMPRKGVIGVELDKLGYIELVGAKVRE